MINLKVSLPSACMNSCITTPTYLHPLPSERSCFPPLRPTLEKHLHEQAIRLFRFSKIPEECTLNFSLQIFDL